LSKYLYWQRNQQKFTQKWGFTALLMENALILCNPRDKNEKYFMHAEQVA